MMVSMSQNPALYLVPLGALVLFVVGLAVAFTPPRKLLKHDRLTGYRIYRSAPDEQTGVRRAGLFYRLFGCGFAAMAFFMGAFITLLAYANP